MSRMIPADEYLAIPYASISETMAVSRCLSIVSPDYVASTLNQRIPQCPTPMSTPGRIYGAEMAAARIF
jgi:hypothetical protein